MGQQNQRPQKVEDDLDGPNPVVKKWTFAKILQRKRAHRRLPLEMECEIFKFLKLKMQQKLIYGMSRGIYGMYSQRVLTKSKRLRNPQGNAWRPNADGIISEDGLVAVSKNTNGWQNVYAEKGFPVSVADCRMDEFPGTILYYYEVKILNSARWCFIGLSDGEILPGGWIGRSPNFYRIDIPPIPNHNIYHLCLAGQHHLIAFLEGVIKPELKETGNAVGCGLLMNPDDKLTIFFTLNGILIGRQFPIDPRVDHLIPTVVWDEMSLEANFGDNPAKPFEYDIKKCPGMGFEWI